MLRRSLLLIILLCCINFTASSQIKSGLNIDIIVNKDMLDKASNAIIGHVFLSNNLSQDISLVNINADLRSYRTKEILKDLDIEPMNGGAAQWIKSGESIMLELNTEIAHRVGEAWVLTASVEGKSGSETLVAADAKMIYAIGVNMDVTSDQDCVNPGDPVDINLISRLLIQEDAAKNPGTVTINIGGMDIEIQLPASQWEARNLSLTSSDLNSNNSFDPFNPPGGVNLVNFCDQGDVDDGRNTANILDECEPINTLRDPCTFFGEDDDLCEFPEWSFCYSVNIPADYMETSFDITATDEYEVWRADEEPPGSGNFGEFQDVSGDIETGDTDVHSVEVKLALPVEFASIEVRQEIQTIVLDWSTATEINNDYFSIERSVDGITFEKIGQIKGSGNSHQLNWYRFDDQQANAGLNYYRIAQVDFDGTRAYSDIVSINFRSKGSAFLVNPNPVDAFFIIENPGKQFESFQLQIFNLDGRLCLTQKAQDAAMISVEELHSGIYALNIIDDVGNIIYTDRLIIKEK